MSTPYLITVSPTAMSFSATLWPSGMSCAQGKRDRPVLVEDQAGQRRAGLDAFDHDHGDRIVGVMQHTMDHREAPPCAATRNALVRILARRSQLYHLYDLDDLHHLAALSTLGCHDRCPTSRAIPAPGVPLAGPLYKDVKRRLTEALTRGEWKPGEAIPAERLLAERCGISIGTVRHAIDELVAENILIRQQGRGTFVASHNRDRMLFYFFHIVDEDGTEALPEVELLSFAQGQGRSRRGGELGHRRRRWRFRIRNRLSLAGDAGDHRRHHAAGRRVSRG